MVEDLSQLTPNLWNPESEFQLIEDFILWVYSKLFILLRISK